MVINKLYDTITLYNEETGITYRTDNLTKFCYEMDLPFRAMYHLIKGRTGLSNGYRLL